MVLEYLFIGSDNREEVESYKPKDVIVEIQNIDSSDFWIVTYSLSGENEKNAKILSEINEYIEKFKSLVLTNESSAYFNKKLYPYFNEFERKLRKLLYLKSAINQDTQETKTIHDLEDMDFGQIFDMLFIDNEFMKAVKTKINNNKFSQNDIIEFIQKQNENTLWKKLFGETSVKTLQSNYNQLRNYRNDVMHAHNLSYKKFSSALKLMDKVNSQLDSEIGKIIGQKEDKIESTKTPHFNMDLNQAINSTYNSSFLKTLQRMYQTPEYIARAQMEMPPMLEKWREIQEGFEAIMKQREGLEAMMEQQTAFETLMKQREGFEAMMEQQTAFEALMKQRDGFEAIMEQQTAFEALMKQQEGLQAIITKQQEILDLAQKAVPNIIYP